MGNNHDPTRRPHNSPLTPAQIKVLVRLLVQHLPQSRQRIQLRPQWTKLQPPTTIQTKASGSSGRGTWQSCQGAPLEFRPYVLSHSSCCPNSPANLFRIQDPPSDLNRGQVLGTGGEPRIKSGNKHIFPNRHDDGSKAYSSKLLNCCLREISSFASTR